MDDLISRQAVLEATSAQLKITGKENAETVYKYIKKLCDYIKALPSAMQWIPCNKKLPEDSALKWVTYINGPRKEKSIAFYSTEEQEWCEPTRGYSFYYPIIAWMPLVHPEPYKGE